MKKLFCLTTALTLAIAIPGSAIASGSADELVKTFCEEAIDAGIKSDEEVADMVRSYMAELEEPSIDQILALSEIAEEVEDGKSLKKACN